ncbi:hypothetical protein AB0J38_27305 [Streptomyces sp. NPDC050095]|uniref:hypothetical protein n=1 Tax=unclassified Streptomyces TaxID=2593676 RepID=UPI003426AF51
MAGGFGAPPPMFAPAPPAPPSGVPGPEFVAADQYSGLVIDAEGVHFEQGPHAIDLPWAHLRTVHFQPLDAGISVTAVTLDGPVYACQVRARRRSHVPTWCTDLAAVLHHYLQGRP